MPIYRQLWFWLWSLLIWLWFWLLIWSHWSRSFWLWLWFHRSRSFWLWLWTGSRRSTRSISGSRWNWTFERWISILSGAQDLSFLSPAATRAAASRKALYPLLDGIIKRNRTFRFRRPG